MFESIESALLSKIFWITAIIILFYLYLKIVVFSYWKRHGVPHEEHSMPFGICDSNLLLKRITLANQLKRSYEKFKTYSYHGLYIFHNPVMMINDPELIKHILVKDFTSFPDRGLYFNDKVDPMSSNLLLMPGDKWKILRAKLSPTFTPGKLKNMYPFIQGIAREMISVCNENLKKYSTDTIFSLAFGFNSDCLSNPDNEFRHYGNLAIKKDAVRAALGIFAPSILDFFKIPFTNPKVSAFFIKLFEDMVEKRRMDKTNRKDFLNLLIELIDHGQIIDKEAKKSESIVNKLKVVEVAAQAFAFFVAGFETSSSTVTHCLYELALNPDIQEKAYAEIDHILQESVDCNYEDILHLEYLDMVLYETMRKHPSVAFLNRLCIKDYKIPDSNFVIPKGMGVIISVSGIHRNPIIYPEPDKFDPTRFNKENTAARHPYTYLAFGEGPRFCIGKRLGILQSKVALVALLSNFKFSKCEKTLIPNQYNPDSIFLTPKGGVYLQVEKRNAFCKKPYIYS